MSKVTDFTNLAPKSGGTTDYIPSNKEEEKSLPDVEFQGKIEYRKKPWWQRASADAKKAFPVMLKNNLLPRLGEIAFDEIVELGRSVIFGTPYVPGRTAARKGSSYFFKDSRVVDYDDIYGDKRGRSNDARRTDRLGSLSYDEFLFTDRMDVEHILSALTIEAKEHHRVSISDLYAIIRLELKRQRYSKDVIAMLEKSDYSDENYGWYYDDLTYARVGTLRSGRFYLDLPEAVAIK